MSLPSVAENVESGIHTPCFYIDTSLYLLILHTTTGLSLSSLGKFTPARTDIRIWTLPAHKTLLLPSPTPLS